MTSPALKPIVLKLGSSALRSPADLPKALTEIMRWRKEGAPVLAVVSAIGEETDTLVTEAASFQVSDNSAHRAQLISLGEARTAARLALICEQAGLEAAVLDAAALDWRASGPRNDATPISVDVDRLSCALAAHDVVIIPGFAALDEAGDPVLLGRGGCDLAAIFLGAQIGAADVRLIKDVDGVYDHDPACPTEEPARRFSAVSWAQAREVSEGLVQDKALAYARDIAQPITLAAFAREAATRIGDRTRRPVTPGRHRPLRIALAGCGVVGGGVLHRLNQEPDRFCVTRILVTDKTKPRSTIVPSALLTADLNDLFQDAPDVIIETTTGTQTAERIFRTALGEDISIITANKQAVAAALPKLNASSQAQFRYAACVGGGAPMIETVRAARHEGEIASVEGVLTGTANFVLDQIASGEPLTTAVKAAQRAGLAEADPSDDLTGRDAAAKLRILAFEAFGVSPDALEIEAEPVTDGTTAKSGTLRQIARLQRQDDRILASIRLEPASDPLFADLHGAQCALKVALADGRTRTTRGLGAGRWPTTESVLADLGDIARWFEQGCPEPPAKHSPQDRRTVTGRETSTARFGSF